jgi:hypothetical protein
MNLIEIITKQNYFTRSNNYYTQTDDLPIGWLISGTLAEIFISHLEREYILSTNKNKYASIVIYWYVYVDIILFLYKGNK